MGRADTGHSSKRQKVHMNTVLASVTQFLIHYLSHVKRRKVISYNSLIIRLFQTPVCFHDMGKLIKAGLRISHIYLIYCIFNSLHIMTQFSVHYSIFQHHFFHCVNFFPVICKIKVYFIKKKKEFTLSHN